MDSKYYPEGVLLPTLHASLAVDTATTVRRQVKVPTVQWSKHGNGESTRAVSKIKLHAV